MELGRALRKPKFDHYHGGCVCIGECLGADIFMGVLSAAEVVCGSILVQRHSIGSARVCKPIRRSIQWNQKMRIHAPIFDSELHLIFYTGTQIFCLNARFNVFSFTINFVRIIHTHKKRKC
jgi:hypothetical protein